MASKRYGSGVFVRLTGEQEMFVRELAVGGVSRKTVIRAAVHDEGEAWGKIGRRRIITAGTGSRRR